jgi:hypothetical protein
METVMKMARIFPLATASRLEGPTQLHMQWVQDVLFLWGKAVGE